MKKIRYIILISITFLSCKNKNYAETSTKILENKIEIKDSVTITIGMNEFYKSRQNHIRNKNDSVYLFRESNMHNAIDIYNWNKKKKVKRITYKTEGPNMIRGFGGSAFYPLKNDTIFIANLAGEIYVTKEDSVISYQRNELRFYAQNPYKPVKIENEVFLEIPSDYLQTDAAFKTRPLIASYNLVSKKIKIANIEYPDIIKNNCWSQHHIRVLFTKNNKNQLIISFPQLSNIYVYDIAKDVVVSEYEAKSNFVKDIPPYKDCDFNDSKRYFRYLKSVAQYRSLNYDKYKDVYYRIVMLPQEEEEGGINGQRNQDIVMPFSIMVLDKDFKVLAERKFPAKTYDPIDFFITKRGLWLSTNNEGSPTFNENELAYDLIGFEKKQT